MKLRRVLIELEVTTALPLKILKDKIWWGSGMLDNRIADDPVVEQVQVNVVKK